MVSNPIRATRVFAAALRGTQAPRGTSSARGACQNLGGNIVKRNVPVAAGAGVAGTGVAATGDRRPPRSRLRRPRRRPAGARASGGRDVPRRTHRSRRGAAQGASPGSCGSPSSGPSVPLLADRLPRGTSSRRSATRRGSAGRAMVRRIARQPIACLSLKSCG